MNRITIKDLQEQVARLNAEAGFDENASWPKFMIAQAYGGNCLALTGEFGSQRHITQGFVPKRELYNQIIYMDGEVLTRPRESNAARAARLESNRLEQSVAQASI